MRMKEREIKDFNEIVDVLRRTDTVRLGINGELFPYVVPLSFGFEVNDGKINIYVHGAKEGFKHELIEKNNHVCIEADIFHGYVKHERGITTEYESVIGFGTAKIANDEETVKGLDLLLEHCGYQGYEYDKSILEFLRVYKIELSAITGKRNVK